MATVPTECPYPPLTADLIARELAADEYTEAVTKVEPRKAMAENTRLFIATYVGGFVFFLTFLG